MMWPTVTYDGVSVCVSVCPVVISMNPAKMAELIQMLLMCGLVGSLTKAENGVVSCS